MKKTLWTVCVLVLISQTVALAAVTAVRGKTTANWRIQAPTPGSKMIVVGPQEPLPVIEDGSSVHVEGGEAQLTTTGKSTVYLVEAAVNFKLLENTTCKKTAVPAALAPNTEKRLIEVVAGKVTVTQPDKRVLTLGAGDQVSVTYGGNLDVVKGKVVLSESSGETTEFGAGKSLEGFCKITPSKSPPSAPLKIQ